MRKLRSAGRVGEISVPEVGGTVVRILAPAIVSACGVSVAMGLGYVRARRVLLPLIRPKKNCRSRQTSISSGPLPLHKLCNMVSRGSFGGSRT